MQPSAGQGSGRCVMHMARKNFSSAVVKFNVQAYAEKDTFFCRILA